MLKKILTSIDGLHEELSKLYVKKDDGKFHLALEDDDAEPLRRAKEHEVGLRQIAERDLTAARELVTELQTKVTTLESQASQSTQELRADHERAVAALKEDHKKATAALEGTIQDVFVNGVAKQIAKDIALDEGAEEMFGENLLKRLKVEMVNGKPVTRVLNKDGTASNMSPDDLKNEYLQNTKYASMLRASDASGGGASGGVKGGGATGKKLSEMGDAERTEWATRDPAGFAAAVAAQNP